MLKGDDDDDDDMTDEGKGSSQRYFVTSCNYAKDICT